MLVRTLVVSLALIVLLLSKAASSDTSTSTGTGIGTGNASRNESERVITGNNSSISNSNSSSNSFGGGSSNFSSSNATTIESNSTHNESQSKNLSSSALASFETTQAPSLSPLAIIPVSEAVTTGPYLPPPEIFGNRVLIMALSFDVTHSDAMNELLSEYLSMCEGGWNVTGKITFRVHPFIYNPSQLNVNCIKNS